jgi:hypothetical protein
MLHHRWAGLCITQCICEYGQQQQHLLNITWEAFENRREKLSVNGGKGACVGQCCGCVGRGRGECFDSEPETPALLETDSTATARRPPQHHVFSHHLTLLNLIATSRQLNNSNRIPLNSTHCRSSIRATTLSRCVFIVASSDPILCSSPTSPFESCCLRVSRMALRIQLS